MRDGRVGAVIEWVLLRRSRLLFTLAGGFLLAIYGFHAPVSPLMISVSALVAHGVFWLLEHWLNADARPVE